MVEQFSEGWFRIRKRARAAGVAVQLATMNINSLKGIPFRIKMSRSSKFNYINLTLGVIFQSISGKTNN